MGIILILALILEGFMIRVPLMLLFLLAFHILKKSNAVLYYAFFSGFILDIFFTRTFGITSLFFITFLLIVSLYENKFEIKSLSFAIFASLFGSLGYSMLFYNTHIFLEVITSAILGGCIQKLLLNFTKYEDRRRVF